MSRGNDLWLIVVGLTLIAAASSGSCKRRKEEPVVPTPEVKISAVPVASVEPPPPKVRVIHALPEVMGGWHGQQDVVVSGRKPGKLYGGYLHIEGEVECGLAGSPQLNNPTNGEAGVWWVGYCRGPRLVGENDALRVTFELTPPEPTLKILVGDMSFGPYHPNAKGGTD